MYPQPFGHTITRRLAPPERTSPKPRRRDALLKVVCQIDLFEHMLHQVLHFGRCNNEQV